ncbi:MAG: tyrosine-type recombinase/integrase [Acidobacteria bacterium]|nr:tyrosine-type recombinase/integrase [Acidobacteriota bacterium]
MAKRKRDALTDVQIRKAKPREKPYKLADGRGLYLYVKPNGSRLWRMDTHVSGRWNTLSFGEYPLISLREARDKRDESLKLKLEGRDPALVRRAIKKAQASDQMTFEVVAREWHGKNLEIWTRGNGERILRWLEKDVFPYLGSRPIAQLVAMDVLPVCQRIEARGARDTAHRVLQTISCVFRFAVVTGRATGDPTSSLRGALAPHRPKHRATLIEMNEIGMLLRAMDNYQGDPVTRVALRLTPLLMLRPGELRRLEWSEINLETSMIKIPAEKMKMRSPHLVPLSRQAVTLLKEILPLTGDGSYVFPSARKDGRSMSENTIRSALIRLGYKGDEQTAHGFRAMASTILNEQGFHPDAIERQLAHSERNKVRAAYNHAEHLPERRRMMQDWADCLDRLREDKSDPRKSQS